MKAFALLSAARRLYDDPALPLEQAASSSWQTGFASGAKWMSLALSVLRNRPASHQPKFRNYQPFQWLGLQKYSLALMGACLATGLGLVLLPSLWSLLSFGVGGFVFYAIEVQMVFLFPLALDGEASLWKTSRCWTRKAGGTWAAMRVVLPLAVVMMMGGLVGQGFRRSWCLGCLSVVLWYEEIRQQDALSHSNVVLVSSSVSEVEVR